MINSSAQAVLFFYQSSCLSLVVAGVEGTVVNRNEFSGCPIWGVGKFVGKVKFFVHKLVHAPNRKQPLNELGFPWFPQRYPVALMFKRASCNRLDSRSV